MSKHKNILLVIAVLVLVMIIYLIIMLLNNPEEIEEAQAFETTIFNNTEYKLFTPSNIREFESLPLLVMLHGCTQTPSQFADTTGMNELAEKEKFYVLYPKQTTSANIRACWNWFNTLHQQRDQGEPKLIVDMINDVKNNYQINDKQVFVSGLSAGGAMAVILGVTYPDVFKAIGVGSGLPYQAAKNASDAIEVMAYGELDSLVINNLASRRIAEHTSIIPIIVFHGMNDNTVHVNHANYIISQWAVMNDLNDDRLDNDTIDDEPDLETSTSLQGKEYTKFLYYDQYDKIIMAKYIIHNMGHAWSGGTGGYGDPSGPNQSQIIWDFFKSTINE